ncbi:glucosamine-6-phosphate deaminase NagB-II [Rheinheimera sp. MMS21-TC3]|uniref:glucosamine-6-phosphate deaminase NagB-II n=1 Tax=Rheinheimera sp. MMS21-TC3 TaxID=3072790 RepID=UPI0028C4DC28|nr:SIS domain-containing protein [Rheinheimera sp. MMS21-TC3]WNO60189.1 SIS domain-containing protein [Rheinheimera sp. MMS21-TC3]
MNHSTIMAMEAREAPSRIKEQLMANAEKVQQVVGVINTKKPKFVYIVGRGSSGHAGIFAKYLIEIEIGLPVVSAAPSVASIYHKSLQLADAFVIVISQSGRSPDLLAQADMAKKSGAVVLALVNDISSPLASMADYSLPLNVGEEKAVAATKSYLATLSAILHLVSVWSAKPSLMDAVQQLPALMQQAVDLPVQLNTAALINVKHLVVLGRGLGYAVSREIALKLKEVCGIQAEAFSSAEFLHGPVTLIKDSFTIIDVSINDETIAAHSQQITDTTSRGAAVLQLHHQPIVAHQRLLPLLVLQRFYIDVEVVARDLGIDPDAPVGLNKVTKTL